MKSTIYELATEILGKEFKYLNLWNSEGREDNFKISLRDIVETSLKDDLPQAKINKFLSTVNKKQGLFKNVSVNWNRQTGLCVSVRIK